MDNWKQLSELISNSHKIILSTHIDPDGDGLGSEVAFYLYLKSINKDVTILNISETPDKYKFLDENNYINTFSKDFVHVVEESDLIIVFDLGDFTRIGKIGDIVIDKNIKAINIDHHHLRDDSMYELSIVDTKSPSTTYMIWKYLNRLGLTEKPLENEMALALYSGLVNDTGSFRYSSVTSDSHLMAAHLLKSKINPNQVFSNIYENISLSKIKLKAELIDNIKMFNSGQVAYAIISESMFIKTNSNHTASDGFSEFIRGIKGVEIAFCITERENEYKISFRSDGKYTINDVAGLFGGGGHYFAAGCKIKKNDLKSSIQKILNECNRKINNGN